MPSSMKEVCVLVLIIVVLQCSAFRIEVHQPKVAGCQISMNRDLTDKSPLFLQTGSNEIVYPSGSDDILRIPEGKKIDVACPGSSLVGTNQDVATVSCSSGKLQLEKQVISLNNIQCSNNLFHTARYTGKSCVTNKKEVEIGFALSNNRFIRQIGICFDDSNQNTLYSHHTVTKSLASQAHKVPRPFFIQDNFYRTKTSVSKLYARQIQRRTINTLVGLPPTSQKYVHDKDYLYLSRGHMSPKAAFVYPIQQNATFHYVNTAPQWQTFNGGNWNEVETDVRNYAERNHVDLDVYTGSYGIASLPHEKTGQQVPLYLYANGNDKALAVPKLYWKVLYNPKNKAGLALIGVNNPYLKEVADNVVCKDISSQISWLSWDRQNFEKGYSYACEVNELRKVVSHVPKLDVVSILK